MNLDQNITTFGPRTQSFFENRVCWVSPKLALLGIGQGTLIDITTEVCLVEFKDLGMQVVNIQDLKIAKYRQNDAFKSSEGLFKVKDVFWEESIKEFVYDTTRGFLTERSLEYWVGY